MRMTRGLVALALTMTICGHSLADMSSFGFSLGDLSARADFVATGDTLVVTLWNTATVDVGNPGMVLTGLFFDINGYTGTGLTRVKAMLTDITGTPVIFTINPHTGQTNTRTPEGYNNFAFGPGDVGAESGYRFGASSVLAGTGDHSFGQIGMDDWLGITTRFDLDDSHDLQEPKSLNGIEYGIVNSTYTGGGNAPVDGKYALITTGVQYTFTGFSGFNASHISNVSYNYGTTFNPIPAPGAAGLGVIGLTLMAGLRRRL